MRAICLASALALAACGGPPPPPPAEVKLTLHGGADQNKDAAGRANPVAVHLYQLTSRAKFDRADVFGLLDDAKQALGEDAMASETVLLKPGDTMPLILTMKPGVTVLGAVVGFREIDSATWRVSAPVKPSGPTALDLDTSANTAALKPVAAPR